MSVHYAFQKDAYYIFYVSIFWCDAVCEKQPSKNLLFTFYVLYFSFYFDFGLCCCYCWSVVWESFSFWNIFSLAILIPLIHPDVPFSFPCIRKWIVSIQRQHIPVESEAFFFHFYFVFYSFFLLFECLLYMQTQSSIFGDTNTSHAFV